MNNAKYEIAGVISVISGILGMFFTIAGFFGLLIFYQSSQKIQRSSTSTTIISLFFIVSLSFYCGFFGYQKLKKKKNLAFYNSLLLISFGIFQIIVSYLFMISAYEFILNWISILLNTGFILVHSMSFLFNGVNLLQVTK